MLPLAVLLVALSTPRDLEFTAEFKPDGKSALDVRGITVPLDATVGEWHKVRLLLAGSRATLWIDGKLIRKHVSLGVVPLVGMLKFVRAEGRKESIRALPPSEANKLLRDNGPTGYESVFNGKDFTGWAGPLDQYEVIDGAIVCKPKKGGNIHTRAEYADFGVRLEYKLPPGGNNGLAIRYPGKGQPSQVAMCEVQILDDTAMRYAKLDPRQYNGSAYGMLAAERGHLRPIGEWNFIEVTVKGHGIEVELNGTVITRGDLSKVKTFMGGKANPGRLRVKGHFGFCGHSDSVAFRGIEIRELK